MSELPPKPPTGATPPPMPPHLRQAPPPRRDVPPPYGYVPPETVPDAPLPALRLETFFKSPQSIIDAENVQSIAAWHDYTIIVPKGTDPIIVVDRFGNKVSDFDKLGQKIITMDWVKYGKKVKSGYLALDSSTDDGDHKISQLPPALQKLGEILVQKHRKNNHTYVSFAELPQRTLIKNLENVEEFLELEEASCTTDSQVVICKETDTIYFYDHNSGLYIRLITRNPQGTIQPPRNWKRDEGEIKTSIPEALKTIVNEEGQGIKKLNDKYNAKVTDPNHDQVHILQEGNSVYMDNITGVGNNICADPTNPDIIYYCKRENPTYLRRLDTSGEPATWVAEQIPMPTGTSQVNDLRFEPNGAFFTFHNADGLLVMLEKNTLKSVDLTQVPSDLKLEFDSDGKIRRIDEDGYLVIQTINLGQLAQSVRSKQIAGLASSINIGALFQREVSASTASPQQATGKDYSHLNHLRTAYEPQFAQFIDTIEGVEGFDKVQDALDKFELALQGQGLPKDEIEYVAENIKDLIASQREEVAAVRVGELIDDIRTSLTSTITIGNMAEVRESVDEVRKLKPFVVEAMRKDINGATQEFERQVADLFRREGDAIQQKIDGHVAKARRDLENFETLGEFNDWREMIFPKIVEELSSLINTDTDTINSKVIEARKVLREMADEYKEKFQHRYQEVRVKAARRIDDLKEVIEAEIKDSVERLRMKQFTDRNEAEQYKEKSPAFRALNDEITKLRGVNPDAARDLHNIMQAQLSVVFSEIERGTQIHVAETGQQMVRFGDVLFPKWEGEVKEKVEPRVDPCFIADEGTRGSDLMGDVGLKMLTSYGRIIIRRIFEGMDDESEWRDGIKMLQGQQMPSTYMSQENYLKFRRVYNSWMQKFSKLKKELADKKQIIDEHNASKPQDESGAEFQAWRKKAMELYKDSAKFYAENYITLLRRIDNVRELPEEEYTNGKGYVPEWQSHWVADPETEMHLENMAKKLKMQQDLQEGALLLKGHAGTGKDVLIKMFCERTKRPYFAMDCTKWTTEFELSEDIILESKDGASQTVKVPSVVLNAITTPGAVMYFNEFNAMPEQAQIFLHALFDEKRSLTLKTSSGQTVKTHPSVLFAASMNPNYKGTFPPQLATRSRFNSYEIGYPKMKEEKTDKNPNPRYCASEALRIARGVESLIGYTWEANMERNMFVKMWNVVVNGESDASVLISDEEKFDIEVILALVQFGNKLRDNFVKKFRGGPESINALPVEQPFTLREARRCAYLLGQMSPEMKVSPNDPEKIAKNLIKEEFLFQIDNVEDREKIEKDMKANWTMERRVAVA